jgi:hypothetical protein
VGSIPIARSNFFKGWIVFKGAIGRAFEIVELARAERPQERCETEPAESKGRRHEPSKRRHGRTLPARRAALATTRIDDVDMTMAAISGVTRPAMASTRK